MLYTILILISIAVVILALFVRSKMLLYFGIGMSILSIGYSLYKIFWGRSERENFKFIDDDDYTITRPEMYCGDLDLLPDGYDYVGTRRECLSRGIGIGMSLPESTIESIKYAPPKPAPREKSYCGNQEALPAGYQRFATRYECLKKGVGIGARAPAETRTRFKAKPPKRVTKRELIDMASRFKIPSDTLTRRETAIRVANAIRDLV